MGRKVGFHVVLVLHRLCGIPVSKEPIYASWKLRRGLKRIHGKTPPAVVKEHVASWEEEFSFDITVDIDKTTGVLKSCPVKVRIKQRTAKGKIFMGHSIINISEYGAARQPVRRRYLLEESRTNTALELSVRTELTSGDPAFKLPVSNNPLASLVVDPLDSDGEELDPSTISGAGPAIPGMEQGDPALNQFISSSQSDIDQYNYGHDSQVKVSSPVQKSRPGDAADIVQQLLEDTGLPINSVEHEHRSTS
eukprot:GCRY01000731.1.p1 GENE.GCRY01000731.1~~GCRY01000731.1.p1  ORF type:complete len:250 (+),score=23.58 GCRY01000731.1:146-895(+)